MSLAESSKVGWFKANRSHIAGELMRANKNAFLLLYVIAARARWREGFNAHGLAQGEAFIGDHAAYGLSEQEYRTAKAMLKKHGFATFKPTSKGTVATLANSTVFDISQEPTNGQTNGQPTDSQRTNNGPTTGSQRLTKTEKTDRRIDPSESKPKETTPAARITKI